MTLSELRSCIQFSKLNDCVSKYNMSCSYCGCSLVFDDSFRCVHCGANYRNWFISANPYDLNRDYFDIKKFEEKYMEVRK